MKLIKKDKKGFTLVELIVVIAILAILALILIPAITGYVSKAEKSKNEANARALYSQASFEIVTAETELDSAAITELETKIKPGDGTVTITYDYDTNKLTSVTYKSSKGDVVTFDGSKFTTSKDKK